MLYRFTKPLTILFKKALGTYYIEKKLNALLLQNSCKGIYEEERNQDPKRLIKYGYKVYSQTDEDGIIQEIFLRIGIKNKIFVEIGVGTGLDNNTLNLLIQGWKGSWFDADLNQINQIKKKFSWPIENNTLQVFHKFITKENINENIEMANVKGEIDFLSIDIDGNDYHVFSEISQINPRVVVIEYNSKFRPPTEWVKPYQKDHIYDGTDYFGASLQSFENLFSKRGYKLVGCNISGSNAFFIRNDLVGDKFCEPFSAKNHYEPARYWLTEIWESGHPANFGIYQTHENLEKQS